MRLTKQVLGLILWAFFALTLAPGEVFGASQSCSFCSAKMDEIQKTAASLKLHEELLQKNKAYLAGLSPNDLSRSIKVKSNIMVFDLRIETMKNTIQAIQQEVQGKGCESCPKKM